MKNRVVFYIVIAVMVFVGIPYGMLWAEHRVNNYISQVYEKEFVLCDQVVFDDEATLEKYGEPLVLNAGDKGKITDIICGWGDELGYEYMEAKFWLDDGSFFSVAIPVVPDYENPPKAVVELNKIADADTLVSEYNQSREMYQSKVNGTRIYGIVIGLIISVVIPAASLIAYGIIHKKARSSSVLLGGLIVMDVVLVLGLLYEMI